MEQLVTYATLFAAVINIACGIMVIVFLRSKRMSMNIFYNVAALQGIQIVTTLILIGGYTLTGNSVLAIVWGLILCQSIHSVIKLRGNIKLYQEKKEFLGRLDLLIKTFINIRKS